MNDSNSAIKVQIRESGQLVVKLGYPCEVLANHWRDGYNARWVRAK